MFRRVLTIKLIILCSFAGNTAVAQQDDYIVNRVEERDFTRRNVTSINQDSEGYIWFGTESGLFRYDAHTIVPFQSDAKNTESIPNNSILDTYQDPHGQFWVTTQYAGLSLYNPINHTFRTFDPTRNRSDHDFFEPFEFDKITGDADPYLWLIPVNRPEIYRFDTVKEVFHKIEIDFKNQRNNNTVSSVLARSVDEIWVGTSFSGIVVINSKGEEVKRFRIDHDDPMQEELSYSILSLVDDGEKGVWIGTYEGGIFYYDLEKELVIKPESLLGLSFNYLTNIYDLYLDDQGMLWAGTDDGLLIFDTESMQIVNLYTNDPNSVESLANNRVRSIYQDQSGLYWVGLEYGGVHTMQRKYGFITINDGPQSPVGVISGSVRAFTIVNDNELWVGVDNEGIQILDYETYEWIDEIRHDPSNPNSLSIDGATRFLHDPDGGIWIGTWGGGLNYYNPQTENFTRFLNDPDDPTTLPDNRVQTLFIDSKERFWVGTERGLVLFDRDEGIFERVLNNPQIPPVLSHQGLQSLSLIEDEEGILWIGTWNGLNRYDPENNTIRHYHVDYYNPSSIRSDRVISLYDDGEGTLWIGTYGGGLSRLEKETDRITTYTQVDGLGNNVVFGILPDNEGYLWLSTSNGLSRLNPQTEFFVTYNRQDGIISDEFWWGSALSGPDGRLMFGSTFGFTIFDPSEITERSYTPPIRISSVSAYDTPVYPDHENVLELSYRDNLLTVGFAALDFANSNRIEYAYMLEGVDRDWIYSGNRNYATYSFLRGGDYTFNVRATDSNGIWLDETATLTIRIKPPLWQKLWFQSLIVGIILLLIWLFIKYRSIQIVKLNQKLEAEVKERTKDLAEKQEELLTRNQKLETQAKQLIEQKKEIEAQKETILQKTDALERSNKNLLELNEDKNNLIGLVSHDLRAPLATVLGAVQLFKSNQDIPKEQQMKMFEMLEEMMIKQLQMVSNILDIDSIESGKIKLQLESVEVVETTKDLISRYKEKAEKKEIEMELKAADEKLFIRADKNYLADQVFGNLLSNALKFSPGQSKVEILLQSDRNNLKWCVKDQGPGISEIDQKKLFGKYQKLSARPTGGESSTGLGLSIVKRLVDEMNGKVWCESEHGNGATFWVEFPLDVNNG